jgi:2-(1,2-epoxy-1,2-dihydrophenyl)acetyl-CoA isomerase
MPEQQGSDVGPTEVGPAEEEPILYRLESDVAWITLNRPAVQNALQPVHRNHLITLFEEATIRPDIRAVVITATGRAFCTGADLRGQPPAPPRPAGAPERIAGDVARNLRIGAQRLMRSIWDCEKPVVAAVNGTAAGIGAHIALACDLVVAADTARFIEVFARRALIPDAGGAWLLPRLIGPHRAKELMFFGDDVSAEEALRLGMINRVVPADELEKTAQAWAERLATGPTRMLALTKRLINRSLDVDLATSLEEEAASAEINMTTADGQEGVASFVERRPPVYRGW